MSKAQQDINARISQFIEFKGLSLHRFGEKASFASGGLSRAIKEHRTFSVEKLMNIYSAFPELNPIWLQFGEGDMIKDGYELVATPGKVKSYEPTTASDSGTLMTLDEAMEKIQKLEKEVLILEAKNETLLDVLRGANYMGVDHKSDKDH